MRLRREADRYGLPIYNVPGGQHLFGLFGATESEAKAALSAADSASNNARSALQEVSDVLAKGESDALLTRLNRTNEQLASAWRQYSEEGLKLWANYDTVLSLANSTKTMFNTLTADIRASAALATGSQTLKQQITTTQQVVAKEQQRVSEEERKAAEEGLVPYAFYKTEQATGISLPAFGLGTLAVAGVGLGLLLLVLRR
jgi:hypothetical protein